MEAQATPIGLYRATPRPTGTRPTNTRPTGTRPTGTRPTDTRPTATEYINAVHYHAFDIIEQCFRSKGSHATIRTSKSM